MNKEELIQVLREFDEKRVEELPEKTRNIFYAIMKIADERDELENIRKEAIEYIKNNKETREHYEPYGTPMGNSNYTTTHIFGYYELLDILNKGDKNE